MNTIQVKIIVTIPSQEMERYKAWGYGMNLLKSSIPDVRKIGAEICHRILDFDDATGSDIKDSTKEINEYLKTGNPK